MQAEFFWELFCETGAPEVYLLYRRELRAALALRRLERPDLLFQPFDLLLQLALGRALLSIRVVASLAAHILFPGRRLGIRSGLRRSGCRGA